MSGPRDCPLVLVSLATDTTAVDWGMRFERLSVRLLLFAAPVAAACIRQRGHSPYLQLVELDAERVANGDRCDRLSLLAEAGRLVGHGACILGWVDLPLCYRNLSFEYLYDARFLRRTLDSLERLVVLPVPGYPPESFFAGPIEHVAALAEIDPSEAAMLIGLGGGAHDHPDGFVRLPGTIPVDDPNLYLSWRRDQPALHIIGDSHVYNCFTPNALIGCRAHVLWRHEDIAPMDDKWSLHFSHHLGSRTMHRAGRPGELQAVARHCGLRDGDTVIWVFGEIDVRCHMVRQCEEAGRELLEVASSLASRFFAEIDAVQGCYPGLRQIVFAPIPPLDNPGYASADFPIHGDILARIGARAALVEALQDCAAARAVALLDVAEHFRTERGDLRWEMSDHFCHLSHGYQPIVLAAAHALLDAGGLGSASAVPS